ncbi:uncharacterized protein HD556DRAFT_1343692 [Suillus plorans]|uniref:Uncharacterized protein n=1 Tax=Suillus plorans TaxID=116603 RepID=A0A9P7J2V1_9AGAM|nr:uncharacterized protein HD556DRAFT_1343692 [Suillus plorans]KAG1800434.1 hypothetical protein HD556DRAFT_1343692 [Suillus plorans]
MTYKFYVMLNFNLKSVVYFFSIPFPSFPTELIFYILPSGTIVVMQWFSIFCRDTLLIFLPTALTLLS